MNLYSTSIFLFALLSLNAQELRVEYEVILNDEDPLWGYQDAYNILLISNKNHSLEYISEKDTVLITSKGLIWEVNSTDESKTTRIQFVKDLRHNVIKDYYSNKNVIVLDSIQHNYKLGAKSKVIMGYKAKQFFLKFRGRYYEGYFSEEIPISTGPFKFVGMPGVVLEIYSHDKAVKIESTSLIYNEDAEMQLDIKTLNLPKDLDSMPYDEYVDAFLNLWYRIIKKNESENPDAKSSFNSRRIEILPNKLDHNYENN